MRRQEDKVGFLLTDWERYDIPSLHLLALYGSRCTLIIRQLHILALVKDGKGLNPILRSHGAPIPSSGWLPKRFLFT